MKHELLSRDKLFAGMARCVREWILPYVADPMGRIQAAELGRLLERMAREEGGGTAAEGDDRYFETLTSRDGAERKRE